MMYDRHRVTTKVQVSRQLRYRPALKLFLGFIFVLFLAFIPAVFVWVFYNSGFEVIQIALFSTAYFVLVLISFHALLTNRLKRSVLLPINWNDGDIGFNMSILSVLIIVFFLLPFALWFVLDYMDQSIRIMLIIVFFVTIYVGLHIVFKK